LIIKYTINTIEPKTIMLPTMNQEQQQQQLLLLNNNSNSNIIQYIHNDRHVFDELELDDEVLYVETYEKILKVLCSITFVKSAVVRESFLASLNENKIRIVLEMIGRLPKLQSLTIEFPDEIIQANGSTKEKTSCHPGLLCSALRRGESSTLRKLSVRGLKFTTTKAATTVVDDHDDSSSSEADRNSLLVEGSMSAHELSTRICQCKQLRSITLLDLQICHQTDLSSFFYCISNSNTNGGGVELPHLESVEIRLMEKEKFHVTGMKNNYETFFHALLTNNTLKSLILWNMILNDRQTKQICDALSCCDSNEVATVAAANNSRRREKERRPSLQSISGTEEHFPCCNIQHLELWRCDLGSHFGSLLKEVFATNTTIKDLTLSYVPLHILGYFDDDDDHYHHNDENYILGGTGYSNGNITSNNGNRVVATLMNILKQHKRTSNIENIKFFGNNVSVCHDRNVVLEAESNHSIDTCSTITCSISSGIVGRNSAKSNSATNNSKLFSKEAMDAMKDSSTLKSISFHYGNSDENGSNDECIILDKLLKLKKSLKQQKQNKQKKMYNGFIPCILSLCGRRRARKN